MSKQYEEIFKDSTEHTEYLLKITSENGETFTSTITDDQVNEILINLANSD